MKTASASLIALLNTNQFIFSDLFTFTLSDATILRFTSADDNLTVSGNVFSSIGPLITRGTTKTVVGIQVDQLQVSFLVNSTVLINTIPLAQFAMNGGFDGARLKLERVFMATWGDTSAGTLINFVGRVSDVTCTRAQVDLNINSDLELLNIMLPRNVYQAGCIHTLYDTGCGLVAATFTVTGNTTANSTSSSINCNLTQNASYFDLGTITYTTGNNAGVTRSVKSYTTGVMVPSLAFPFAPATGDLFTSKPGCDKLAATCNSSKFSNLANFRGFTTIPVPEASY